jgi:hypothetical protein
LKQTNKIYSTHSWLQFSASIRIVPIAIITYIIISFENSNKKDLNETYSLECLLFLVLIQLFFSGLLTTFTFTTMMEISYASPASIQATHYSLLATFEILGKLLLQPIVSAFTDSYGYSNGFILFTFFYLICLISFCFKPKLIKLK